MQNHFKRLRELRTAAKLTQTQLVEQTKISQSAISAYERGEQIPTVYVLIVLCKFFGVSSDYMIGFSD